jgi:hypothetical protein
MNPCRRFCPFGKLTIGKPQGAVKAMGPQKTIRRQGLHASQGRAPGSVEKAKTELKIPLLLK